MAPNHALQRTLGGSEGARMRSVERWAIMSLATVALVMFVFPILTAKTPRGTRSQTGYDIASSIGEDMKAKDIADAAHMEHRVHLPTSLRFSWLVSVSVGVSFLAALACGATSLWSSMITRVASLIGGAFAVLAVVHIKMANSDMHSFLQAQLEARGGAAADGLQGEIAGGLSSLLVGSVSWSPGLGLYILMACMLAIALVSNSKCIRPSRS